jgi:hypothetical protein
VDAVLLAPEVCAQLEGCWQQQAASGKSLYKSAAEFLELVKQVRAVKRQRPPVVAGRGKIHS